VVLQALLERARPLAHDISTTEFRISKWQGESGRSLGPQGFTVICVVENERDVGGMNVIAFYRYLRKSQCGAQDVFSFHPQMLLNSSKYIHQVLAPRDLSIDNARK
jgi:hypothetical protein